MGEIYTAFVNMPSPPLPFAPPTLQDAAAVRRATPGARQRDAAVANVYLLRHKYGTEIALEGGFLFRHFSGNGRLQGYAFPCGDGDPMPALLRVQEDAALRRRPLRFCLLLEEQRQLLEVLWPGRFRFHADAGDADYLYTREQLAELAGARFHRKRNHLARFEREYPSWNIQPLASTNAADALSVASGWLEGAMAEGGSPALLHEHEAISQALRSMDALALFGAVLYVDDTPVAMSVGSMISDEVADIHYEKCLPAFRSAYPVINRGLARLLACPLINREEDLNQPGLRQAKMSYFPSQVLTKYSALPC